MTPMSLRAVGHTGLKVAQWIVIINLIQASVGVVLIAGQRSGPTTAWFGGNANSSSPSDTVEIERLKSQIEDADRRLTYIERIEFGTRLAVLETRAGDNERRISDIEQAINEIRKLAYGALVTIIVSVIAQFIQIRDARKNRS